MTRHRCTADADTCAVCAQRRDGIEAGPLASDFEAAVRDGEDEWTDWPAPAFGVAPADPPSVRAFLGSTP